jgi:hypothetical protein
MCSLVAISDNFRVEEKGFRFQASGRLVLVLVLVLDTELNIVSQIYFFDYEDEYDDEDDLSQPKY